MARLFVYVFFLFCFGGDRRVHGKNTLRERRHVRIHFPFQLNRFLIDFTAAKDRPHFRDEQPNRAHLQRNLFSFPNNIHTLCNYANGLDA